MRHLPREVLYACRALAARPVLTGTTILTLALGIGGTSAMFSIASGVLLRPLPVPEPHRLVRVFGGTADRALGIISYPNLHDVADRARSFSETAIHQQTFAAHGLGEELRRFLFGVSAVDPWTLAAATLAVLICSALAAYLPARQVSRADLATQLRL